MALTKTRTYSYANEKKDVAISFTFREGPELDRQLSDFLDLLKQAQGEIEKEVADTPEPIKMVPTSKK